MHKFLVVDDSRTLRTIVCRSLHQRGFATLQAENGQVALDICVKTMPDAIVLDWNMPVMDGVAFLKALRMLPNGNDPKVIFCTSESDMDRIATAIEAGADEYIMKPFDDEILNTKLDMIGFAVSEAA
ncbi:MAG: response regulator [Proteobacteria bacterium]|nr:response regulator [Pseudomonadota bacterium]